MRWDEDTIARVKEANEITEIVSAYIPLTKSGSNLKALCPFHQEKTPSFMVNPGRQIFHCFGCHVGGDVIRFVMLQDGLPFTDVVEKLAERGGIDLPRTGGEPGTRRDRKDLMYGANKAAAGFYSTLLLKGTEGGEAREYLKMRGIHVDVSRNFLMGYAPSGWRSLMDVLVKEGFDPGLLVECGLAVKGEKGRDPYDRFRNRVVFPIHDLHGRILGFGGRVLGDDLPKYLNTPETPIYRKGDSLFGMDLAAPAIRAEGQVILVEGYLDVISLHQGGIRNVVGVLGTALTTEQAKRIKRLTRDCVLIFDSDEAGVKAALRSGMIFLEEGFRCRIVPLESGEDPDTYLRKRGEAALRDQISNAIPVITFAKEEALKRHPGNNVDGRVQVLDAIIPFLAKIKDRAKLGIYLKEIADELKIEQQDLRAKLGSVKERKQPPLSRGRPQMFLQGWEGLLIHIMVRDPSTIARVKDVADPEDFSSPGVSGLVGKIFSGAALDDIIQNTDDNMKDLLTGWALEDPVEGKEKALDDCLRRVTEKKLDKMIQETENRLTLAAKKRDDAEYRKLTEEWERLQVQRHDRRKSDEKSSGGENGE